MNKTFPIVEVSGTYVDVGRAIGNKMGEQIRKSVEEVRSTTNNYLHLLEKTKPYYEFTNKCFPDLIGEMEAMAKAAGVAREDLFFINNREVFDESEEWDRKDAVYPDHCTIAVSFNESGVVVGHNEDWAESVQWSMYVLKAKVGETSFVGLNYAAAIPGVAASMNNWGLVQCINDLHQISGEGLPKNFLARAVLECRTLNEAEKLIRDTKKASGFNHVIAQGKEVRNFEIAGQKMVVKRVTKGTFIHTNHYLDTEMRKMEEFHTRSSEERYARVEELINPGMTVDQMKILLSDTQNPKYPICREKETVGSLIFSTEKNAIEICYGHPCSGEYVQYNI